MRTSLTLCAVVAVLSSSVAVAQPAQVPIQGTLTDSNGVPLMNGHTLQVSLYSVLNGGTATYSETQFVQVAQGGVFTFYLGATSPLSLGLFDGGVWYVGVKVDGDAEMTPRIALGTVPYAAHSATAATATNASFASTAGTANAVAFGNVTGVPPLCSAGQYLRGYNNGASTCATPADSDTGVTSVSAGTGITASITGRALSVSTNNVQLRTTTPSCANGVISALAPSGAPTCITSPTCTTVASDAPFGATETATCTSGVMVGGGCLGLTSNVLISSYPLSSSQWTCTTQNGAQVQAYVRCCSL